MGFFVTRNLGLVPRVVVVVECPLRLEVFSPEELEFNMTNFTTTTEFLHLGWLQPWRNSHGTFHHGGLEDHFLTQPSRLNGLNFLGWRIFSRENKPFKLFFQGPLAEWVFLSKWVICRFHVNVPGCIFQLVPWGHDYSGQRAIWSQRLSYSVPKWAKEAQKTPNHRVDEVPLFGILLWVMVWNTKEVYVYIYIYIFLYADKLYTPKSLT